MQLDLATARSGGPASMARAIRPVDAEEFEASMAALGPFESRPDLAVAVSGGRDSLALALLANQWVRARGGRLRALIVDHRLRPESADEASHVAALLRAAGIATDILPWTAARSDSGVSENARRARYQLLEARCRALGILHLLLGHQTGDQSETVLLRLADGSGPEGLAGMSSVVERAGMRVLRPLLGVGRDRLGATVLAQGLAWVDDPSNQNTDYARVAARGELGAPARAALNDVARHSAEIRMAIDARLAGLTAALVSVDPRGFAWLDLAGFVALPDRIACRLLGRLAACFGGRHYPARGAGLSAALAELRRGRSTVAGGCRFLLRTSRVLVCRESGAIAPAMESAGGRFLWDRRYLLSVPAALAPGAMIGPLGLTGRLVALRNGLEGLRDLPSPAAEALPALWRNGLLAALYLPGAPAAEEKRGGGRDDGAPVSLLSCLPAAFRPAQGMTSLPWALVLPPGKPM